MRPSLINVLLIHEHAGKMGLIEEQLKHICILTSCIKRLAQTQEIANLIGFFSF
jgi:hypothetical protein